MDYKVGDKAVYPAHGVGLIQKIETRDIMGTDYTMYVLKILDNGATSEVPVENVESSHTRGMTGAMVSCCAAARPRRKLRPESGTRSGKEWATIASFLNITRGW